MVVLKDMNIIYDKIVDQINSWYLCYTIENVNMARIRGLDDIVKIIKECVIIAGEVKL